LPEDALSFAMPARWNTMAVATESLPGGIVTFSIVAGRLDSIATSSRSVAGTGSPLKFLKPMVTGTFAPSCASAPFSVIRSPTGTRAAWAQASPVAAASAIEMIMKSFSMVTTL
jgi:hypothetical protein